MAAIIIVQLAMMRKHKFICNGVILANKARERQAMKFFSTLILYSAVLLEPALAQDPTSQSFDQLFAAVPRDAVGMGPSFDPHGPDRLKLNRSTYQLRTRCIENEEDLERLANKLVSKKRDDTLRAFYLAKLVGFPAIDMVLDAMTGSASYSLDFGKAPDVTSICAIIGRPNINMIVVDKATEITVETINQEDQCCSAMLIPKRRFADGLSSICVVLVHRAVRQRQRSMLDS